MSSVNRIRGAVYRTIDVVNDLLPAEQALVPHDDLVLLGMSSGLDSMGFVNFIVTLEDELERELGRALDIGDLLDVTDEGGGSAFTVADLVSMLSRRLE